MFNIGLHLAKKDMMFDRNKFVWMLLFFQTSLIVIAQVRLPSPHDYYTPVNTNPYMVVPKAPGLDIFRFEDKQNVQQQNQQLMQEIELIEKRKKQTLKLIEKDTRELNNANYSLPTFSNQKGSEYYRSIFDKMMVLNPENYSIKDLNFQIENAYYESKLDTEEYNKSIKQTGDFLIAKMKELKYDLNSNTAKNFMLFEFFTQTLEVKGFKEKHFPLKYDFEDYRGEKDWSKMFVSKLLKTGTGQCHSLPLLYLILAEEIGAEAYVALSPNHSYIKFQDEKGKWYNIELTNGMFTVSSFILNSGFIKAEAIQNHIYMKNLSKQELLSQFYTDLATGYIHKFGYDQFVEKVAQKALELYPKNINANMLLSNFYTFRFEYATKKLGINPKNNEELQKIRNYPITVKWLNQTNNQYKKIDDLGYQPMPDEAYENWLNSLKEAKNKQENETVKKQFKGLIVKKTKE